MCRMPVDKAPSACVFACAFSFVPMAAKSAVVRAFHPSSCAGCRCPCAPAPVAQHRTRSTERVRWDGWRVQQAGSVTGTVCPARRRGHLRRHPEELQCGAAGRRLCGACAAGTARTAEVALLDLRAEQAAAGDEPGRQSTEAAQASEGGRLVGDASARGQLASSGHGLRVRVRARARARSAGQG